MSPVCSARIPRHGSGRVNTNPLRELLLRWRHCLMTGRPPSSTRLFFNASRADDRNGSSWASCNMCDFRAVSGRSTAQDARKSGSAADAMPLGKANVWCWIGSASGEQALYDIKSCEDNLLQASTDFERGMEAYMQEDPEVSCRRAKLSNSPCAYSRTTRVRLLGKLNRDRGRCTASPPRRRDWGRYGESSVNKQKKYDGRHHLHRRSASAPSFGVSCTVRRFAGRVRGIRKELAC